MALSDFPAHHPQYGELVAYNPTRKRGMYAKWNFETGEEDFTVLTDADDTVEDNHLLRMENQNQTSIGKKENAIGRHIASIPMALMYDQKLDLNKAFQEQDKYFKRWLNDKDNYKFRTNESNV